MPRSPRHLGHGRAGAAPRPQPGLFSSIGPTLVQVALVVLVVLVLTPDASVLPPLLAGALFVAGQLLLRCFRR